MKKIILFLMFAMLVACEKEGGVESGFDYDINELYGTWDVTHFAGDDGKFYSITDGFALEVYGVTSFTFDKNSYQSKGWFDDASGSFVAKGKTLILSTGGEPSKRIIISTLAGGTMQATVTSLNVAMPYDTVIRAKRR